MPHVSVLIAGYRAADTLPGVLRCLVDQTYRDFEVIVVESGSHALGQHAVEAVLPDVVYRHIDERMNPHEALNQAAELAQGELLTFLDADAYPAPDWLEKLLAALGRRGPVVFGGVACFGKDWLDMGAHLCKFDKWLPRQADTRLSSGPTVNMAIAREVFEQVGPFSSSTIHADTDLSWRLRRAGYSLWHVPMAEIEHHHLHSLRSLLRERFVRGHSYPDFERAWVHRTRWQWLGRALLSLLPLRLASQLGRVANNAAAAGMGWQFVRTFPVVCLGLYLWLLGEVVAVIKLVRADWKH